MLKSKFLLNILNLLLDGDKEIINVKPQIDFLTELDSEYTGSGVYIRFKRAKGIDKYKTENENLILNGVVIKSNELEIGADCMLFFKNGLIDYLEIWSFSGKYPKKELKNYVLAQEWKNSPAKRIENK